ncbi:hypothetical protein WDW89_01465 [Deltaproteobacteria bacterium TL4]
MFLAEGDHSSVDKQAYNERNGVPLRDLADRRLYERRLESSELSVNTGGRRMMTRRLADRRDYYEDHFQSYKNLHDEEVSVAYDLKNYYSLHYPFHL